MRGYERHQELWGEVIGGQATFTDEGGRPLGRADWQPGAGPTINVQFYTAEGQLLKTGNYYHATNLKAVFAKLMGQPS